MAESSGGDAPWLATVLVELGVRSVPVVDYVNAALDRAAIPREYVPHAVSFGSDVVDVARVADVGDADRRRRFVDAMLVNALEPREPFSGRRRAIDAIAVVAQRCGDAALGAGSRERIRNAVRPLVQGVATTSIGDFDRLWAGSPAALMLAASRLLLILAEDDRERGNLIQPLLLSLTDDAIDRPRLLSSTLAQVPAEHFQHALLVLAGSRSPEIRALAARHWAKLAAHPGIGRRLAVDPVGSVRASLAHALNDHDRIDATRREIRGILAHDCQVHRPHGRVSQANIVHSLLPRVVIVLGE